MFILLEMVLETISNVCYLSKWSVDIFTSYSDFITSAGFSMSIGTSGSYDITYKYQKNFFFSFRKINNLYLLDLHFYHSKCNRPILSCATKYYYFRSILKFIDEFSYCKTPSLTCSLTSTVIFSLASYNGGQVPTWVSYDSKTGVIMMSTPNVTSSTNYMFHIYAYISGTAYYIQKQITIGVAQCLVSHWDTKKC